MRYITTPEDSSWNFDRYFAYLETVRTQMPAHLYGFAADLENYDLSSHSSLHDAWLEYLNVREVASGPRMEKRRIDIESCYLGPYHNKRIFLSYRSVLSYTLVSPEVEKAPPVGEIGHGDLLVHEVRVESNGVFEHELHFSRGSALLIRFRDFEHRVEPFNNG